MRRPAFRMFAPARRLIGNAIVLRTLPGQRAFVRAPRAHIEAARDRRVRRVVRFAAAHVPHYRDLFTRERIETAYAGAGLELRGWFTDAAGDYALSLARAAG